MKETLHDLEWSQGGAISVTMQTDPRLIKCSSESQGGDLQVWSHICSYCWLLCLEI